VDEREEQEDEEEREGKDSGLGRRGRIGGQTSRKRDARRKWKTRARLRRKRVVE